MGNQNTSNTLFHGGSLKSGDQLESQTNYIQMEDQSPQYSQITKTTQKKNKLQFLSCLQRLNCMQNMRNKRLPDWYNHMKYQLTHNQRFTQHKWSSEILREVESYQKYKDEQEQNIFEVTKASEQSYFDTSEYLARRKDSWRVNRESSAKSSFNSNSNNIHESNRNMNSQMNPQDPSNGNTLVQIQKQAIIEREKKLESIIENTELLQESLQEHRNSIYQIQSQTRKSRGNSLYSSNASSSFFDENGYDNFEENEKNIGYVNVLLNGMSDAIDDYQTQTRQEEEEYDKMFRNLNRYKEITRVLQRHMQNVSKNPLAFILQKYVEIFGFTYDAMKLSQPSMYLKIITEEVSDFIYFVVDILRMYYRLDYLLINQQSSQTIQSTKGSQADDTTQMFFNIDNLQNFICSILFQFDNFYRKMNKLFSEVDEHFQQQFREQIDKKQNTSLQELGIRTEFHLNEQTLALFEKNKEINNKSIDQPYSKAIEHIKKSQITKSPLQKLKIMLKIYEMVESDIRDFYELNHLKQPSSCDADNFLGIIQYILIKAKAYNIYTDLKMIEHFVKNSSSKSASSYKLITLQGSVYHISSSS